MRETIRRCISCILPCGALDVVRIVHADGLVEEISHAVLAGEVMQAHPKHVLRELPSASEEGEGPRGPVVLPPTAELERGKIYFLAPVPTAGAGKRRTKKRKKMQAAEVRGGTNNDTATLLVSDQYLSDILSEKVSAHMEGRRGRAGVWRPHLESISEVPNDF
uniref:Uncharacterized protein n=1 Tax=Anthurium amnicola TaxID=1678845 RepID=A0A1D1XYG9_9ARAE